MKTLYSVEEVSNMIKKGDVLFLSAEFEILKKLPRGNWIGGTTPYFMSEEGGVVSHDKIHIVNITNDANDFKICSYDETQIPKIAQDYFENCFSYIIIPCFSQIHHEFAENSQSYENILTSPLLGWIAGFDLESKDMNYGVVFNGKTGQFSNTKAVAMHVELAKNKKAEISTINLFKQGNGDVLTFEEKDFAIRYVFVNGQKKLFKDYLIEKEIDFTLPLVTDYPDFKVNVSLKKINPENDFVELYAPVFPGIEYQFASPIGDYENEFNDTLLEKNLRPLISCNCILNYLYAKLEGKRTGYIFGPNTFGEIAHVLLNQTTVCLTIIDSE